MQSHKYPSSYLSWVLFFGLLFFCAAVIYFMPPRGMDNNDSGFKYVQMMNFVRNGMAAGIEVEYPGEKIDNRLEFVPSRENKMLLVRNGAVYSAFDPALAYLTAMLYPVLGPKSVHFVPLLSFIIAVVFMYRTLSLFVDRPSKAYLLAFVFGFASPLTNQVFTFAEHLPAVGLATIGIYMIARGLKRPDGVKDISAGILITGACVFFRTEFALFSIIAGSVLMAHVIKTAESRPFWPIFGAMLIPLAAYMLFNFITCGNMLGMHMLVQKPFIFSLQKIIVVVIFITVIAIALEKGARDLFNISILALIGFAASFLAQPSAFNFTMSFPLAIAALFWFADDDVSLGGDNAIWKTLLLIVVIYVLVFLLLFNNISKIQTRFMLPILPLLIVLVGIKSRNYVKMGLTYFLVVILGAFALQQAVVHSALTLSAARLNRERVEFIENNTAPGSVIIFQHSVLAEHAGPLYFDRIFMQCLGIDELRRLEFKMQDSAMDIKEYYLAIFRGALHEYGKDPSEVERESFWGGMALYRIPLSKEKSRSD